MLHEIFDPMFDYFFGWFYELSPSHFIGLVGVIILIIVSKIYVGSAKKKKSKGAFPFFSKSKKKQKEQEVDKQSTSDVDLTMNTLPNNSVQTSSNVPAKQQVNKETFSITQSADGSDSSIKIPKF